MWRQGLRVQHGHPWGACREFRADWLDGKPRVVTTFNLAAHQESTESPEKKSLLEGTMAMGRRKRRHERCKIALRFGGESRFGMQFADQRRSTTHAHVHFFIFALRFDSDVVLGFDVCFRPRIDPFICIWSGALR